MKDRSMRPLAGKPLAPDGAEVRAKVMVLPETVKFPLSVSDVMAGGEPLVNVVE